MADENASANPESTPASDPPPRENAQAAADAAQEAPPSEAVVADADAPVGAPEAVEPAPAEPPAADAPQPVAAEPPPAEAPGPTPAEPPAAQTPEPEPAAAEPPAAQTPEPAADAAAEVAEPEADAAEQAAQEAPANAEGRRQRGTGQGKPRREQRPRRRRDRAPAQPRGRFTGPLPFQELRDAATTIVEHFGTRQALRDAFSALGEKERRDLSRLVSEDGDWRVRARNIAAGSLGAGRVGKALAAQQISMARIEDLWTLTLSKEEADERLSRIRNARRRDERRAQRDADRERRTDRVSRAELEKAQDGRVGAQIRIVVAGERDRRRGKDDPQPPEDEQKPGPGSDVLDRLGY
jgi:hypothetical protein